MDIELFQWVLLGLLALGIVVLVALLATLGGIKKALEQRASSPTPAPEESAPDTAAERPAEQPAAQVEEDTSDRDTSRSDTAMTTPGAAAASTGQAGSIRSVLERHGLSETASQPPQGEATTQPEEAHVVDSVFAAHADDPQEEPFQRDGRWWFRRGDELLLYDEPSGQWQPAPEGSDEGSGDAGGSGAGDTTGATASGGGTATDTGVQTTPVSAQPEVADQVATFWKCPTCGAVNGSTAATCRMCFAARP